MGAYHTLDLEVNRKFTLGKQEWDSIALERIGMCLQKKHLKCSSIKDILQSLSWNLEEYKYFIYTFFSPGNIHL